MAKFLLSVVVLAQLTATALAQAEPPPPPAPVDDRVREPVAAAQIVAMHDGPTALVMLKAGFHRGLWVGRPAKDPAADKTQLEGIEDRKPVLNADQNQWESQAYNYLVLHAREVPVDALRKIARNDLIYANFWEDPKKYRGAAVHIEGRLKRLIKMDAPRILWGDGIKTLYEAWIFPESAGANPYCVIFSEVPKETTLGEKLPGHTVTCDAYFFKRYRYKTSANDTRDAPLFIGRTFAFKDAGVARADEEESSWSFAKAAVPVCSGLVVLFGVLVVALNMWFKRGDRKVQHRIRDARPSDFVAPPPEGYPGEDPRLTAKQPPPPREEPSPQNGTDNPEKLRKSLWPGQ